MNDFEDPSFGVKKELEDNDMSVLDSTFSISNYHFLLPFQDKSDHYKHIFSLLFTNALIMDDSDPAITRRQNFTLVHGWLVRWIYWGLNVAI